MMQDNRPLFSLTVSEFTTLMKQVQGTPLLPIAEETNGKYVYGLAGLSRLLGCSKNTAFRIKKSGKLNEAISQVGKMLIIDSEKVLKLINTNL